MTVPELPAYLDQSTKYTDFLSITLTALAVILATLAIGIGILALWGYREMINAATKAGRDAAQEEALKHLKSTEFKDWLVQEVTGKPTQIGETEGEGAADKAMWREYPKKEGE